jgi:hypothetical protein
VDVEALRAILVDAIKEPELRMLDHGAASADEMTSNVRPDPMLAIRPKNCRRRKDGELASPSLQFHFKLGEKEAVGGIVG